MIGFIILWAMAVYKAFNPDAALDFGTVAIAMVVEVCLEWTIFLVVRRFK